MENLDELVSMYGENDAKLKEWKKTCEEQKSQIKEIMSNEDITDYSAGGYTVKYVVSERTSVDEDKMVDILKKHWSSKNGSMTCPYIKPIYVLDSDALESAIYNGDIPSDVLAELNTCREVTEVVTLKCSKTKVKKGEE